METTATRPIDPALLRRAGRLLLRALSLVACVAAWQWAATHHLDLGLVTFQNVPSPKDVLDAATALLESPKLALHLKASVWRVFAGFVAAGVAGIGLGLVIGRSRRLEDVLLPPLEVLRPIPAVAWIPLAILMFPSSELSMVFITFIGALFPILLNTIHGVEGADPRLVASSRSLGAGRFPIFTEVILPAALLEAGEVSKSDLVSLRLQVNAADLRAFKAAAEDEVLRCEECRRILVRTPESGL